MKFTQYFLYIMQRPDRAKIRMEWIEQTVPVDAVDNFYKENSPFGKDNRRYLKEWGEWNKFISNYKTGDELWYYRSPQDSWAKLAGEEGFAIYRHGKLISRIITVLN
jgi:hypothetical protein